MPVGLYIHYPYCLRRCPYCDFAVEVARPQADAPFGDTLLAELELRVARGDWAVGRWIDTLYVGGGTPSLWHPAAVGSFLARLRAIAQWDDGAEVTLEANPERLDVGRLCALRALGFNRLSLGAQSLDETRLKLLGRRHKPQHVATAMKAAREAGFDNISMDFIYGLPGQTETDVSLEIEGMLALSPEHLSAYALTLTPEFLAVPVPMAARFEKQGQKQPEDGVMVKMADRIRTACESHGLSGYEISNFARAGFEARHNQGYWTQGEWLALGPSASGTLAKGEEVTRYTNVRSVSEWAQAVGEGRMPDAERESLDAQARFTEAVMLGLRLARGVDFAAVSQQHGIATDARAESVLAQLAQDGFLARKEGFVALTNKGRALHGEISARLMAQMPAAPGPARATEASRLHLRTD
ncbi:MAG: radical SAM family heme chaperone HemW [Myxococcaceae bacterium]